MVIQGGMFNDSQPQARTTARLGTTLVHAIEPLEHLALFLGRDANARIGNRKKRMALVVGTAPQRHRTTGTVVADGVTRQVINQLVNQARYAFDDHGLRLESNGHI